MIIEYSKKLKVYEWPFSQICMECTHGGFIYGDHIGDSCYSCDNESAVSDGIYCSGFEAKNMENEELNTEESEENMND